MKYLIIKMGILLLNLIYFFIKIFKSKNKITLISRQSNKITIDFNLLKKEILKHKKYKVIVLCKKLDGKENAKLISKIKYFFHIIKQMYHISTSKIVVLDSYSIAISVLKHKKSLKIIQIWHSIGTMKKFGYEILDQEEGNSSRIARIMKMHKNYDVILCAGEGYVEDLARQFNYNKKYIKVIPLPRVDLLNSNGYKKQITNQIYLKYPVLKIKRNILYVPTFRKDETLLKESINKLIEEFDFNKYNLIIKLHPLSKINIDDKRVFIDKIFSSFDMIFVSDYVITDYSCILYEAGILNKPLYFYCFDYDEYNKNRSFNIDYFNELPGVKSNDIKLILNDIKYSKYDYNKLHSFIGKYVDLKSKNCTKKIYELIDKM